MQRVPYIHFFPYMEKFANEKQSNMALHVAIQMLCWISDLVRNHF